MNKRFYSHIIEIESVLVELDAIDLTEKQRVHLASLIDSSIHHTVLDVILSQLSDEDKKIFIDYLSRNDHEKIWEHLNEKVDNIEEKIKDAAEELKEQIKKDIKEAKEK